MNLSLRGSSFLSLLLGVLLLTGACSSTKKAAAPGGQALSGTDEQIFIGDTIEKNYDPNVIMKRAESFFEKEEYPEAVIEYQHFLDLHRIHALAPYAQFRLGESHFKMVKTVDRDPEPVYKALEAFEKLLKEYPGNRYEADAQDKIRACHNFLAEAHFFVGKFYYRRDAYLAAAHRFEAVIKQYPDMDVAPDALYYLALTYNEIGAQDWARERLIQLAEHYPQNKHRVESQRLFAKLNGGRSFEAVALAGVGPNGSSNGLIRSNGAQAQAAVPVASPKFTSVASMRPAMAAPQASAVSPNGRTAISANGRTPSSTGKTSISSPAAPAPAPTFCRLGVWC